MKGRRRRSPRVPKTLRVDIAGRGADGKVFVESTETVNISRFGVALVTRRPFTAGSQIAVRRESARPVPGQVVSVFPGPEPGLLVLGIHFVTGENYWSEQFADSWHEMAEPDARDLAATSVELTPRQASAKAVRAHLAALDEALEGVARKADAVRLQSENVLGECVAQVDEARRTGAELVRSQKEALAATRASASQELAAEVTAAVAAVRTELDSARVAAAQQSGALRQDLDQLRVRAENVLRAADVRTRERLDDAARRAAEVETTLAASIEARRRTAAELDAQAAGSREQFARNVTALRQEADAAIDGARSQLSTAAQNALREIQQQIPAMGQEAFRFISSILAEQKNAGAQWMEQSLQSARGSFSEIEREARAALADHARQAIDKYTSALEARVQEVRSGGEAVARTLEGRLERARRAFDELVLAADQALQRKRQDLEESSEAAQLQVSDAAGRHEAELSTALETGLQRMRELQDAVESTALDAARRLDQQLGDIQQASIVLDRAAREKRERLEALFLTLADRIEQRKAALDRVLEALENGRAALRMQIESVRTTGDEQQGMLRRTVAEGESALRTRRLEIEEQLHAGASALEEALNHRVQSSLQAAGEKFAASLEAMVTASSEQFGRTAASELEKAGARVTELRVSLDRHSEEQMRAMEAATAAHLARFGEAARELERRSTASAEALAQQSAAASAAVRQAATGAVSEIREEQARAVSGVSAMLDQLSQARAALATESTQLDSQARERQRGLEFRFVELRDEVDRKRSELDSFGAYAERMKTSVTESLASLDGRVEEFRSASAAAQREAHLTLEKRAVVLADQVRDSLRVSLRACEQELGALEEAEREVFQARLRTMVEEAAAAAIERFNRGSDSCAAGMDRSMDNTRREYERRFQALSQQAEEMAREQQRARDEAAAAAMSGVSEQVQGMTRSAIDRVREAHDMFLREIGSRVTAAEVTFRESLDRMLEQHMHNTRRLAQKNGA